MKQEPHADWLAEMDAEVEAMAKAMKRERGAKWPKAPLRRIVTRDPEEFHVNERLECGHRHVAYELPGESKAKRRRCHDCFKQLQGEAIR